MDKTSVRRRVIKKAAPVCIASDTSKLKFMQSKHKRAARTRSATIRRAQQLTPQEKQQDTIRSAGINVTILCSDVIQAASFNKPHAFV